MYDPVWRWDKSENDQTPDQTETFFDHENCILMYQTYIWEVAKKNIRPIFSKLRTGSFEVKQCSWDIARCAACLA